MQYSVLLGPFLLFTHFISHYIHTSHCVNILRKSLVLGYLVLFYFVGFFFMSCSVLFSLCLVVVMCFHVGSLCTRLSSVRSIMCLCGSGSAARSFKVCFWVWFSYFSLVFWICPSLLYCCFPLIFGLQLYAFKGALWSFGQQSVFQRSSLTDVVFLLFLYS